MPAQRDSTLYYYLIMPGEPCCKGRFIPGRMAPPLVIYKHVMNTGFDGSKTTKYYKLTRDQNDDTRLVEISAQESRSEFNDFNVEEVLYSRQEKDSQYLDGRATTRY